MSAAFYEATPSCQLTAGLGNVYAAEALGVITPEGKIVAEQGSVGLRLLALIAAAHEIEKREA